MVREDLVEGAVAFLQDPSVAAAPLEQRMAFLRSKNLTPEEIDASLARAGQLTTVPPNSQSPSIQYQQPPPAYGNASHQQAYPQYWQQPPPEVSRRDWRDWFIAATVAGGVGYALYWTAKRYVVPLIAPPTPPQLEQDKASVDASFDKAFALLEQLTTDTKELKDSEAARKERIDAALADVESIIARMKQANDERDVEAKRIAREISEIRDQVPRAIEKEKEATDNRLKELNVEMKSLKTLVANRMTGGQGPPQRTTPSFATSHPQASSSAQGTPGSTNGSASTADFDPTAAALRSAEINDTASSTAEDKATSRSVNTASGSGSSTPYSRLLNGKAAIPSWQLAEKKRSEDAKTDDSRTVQQNVGESGTASETIDADT